MIFSIYFDGLCDPRKGLAIASYVLKDEKGANVTKGAEVACKGKGATNNVAEWNGLLMGLRAVKDPGKNPFYIRDLGMTVLVYGDSSLVLQQVMGSWECRKDHLKPFLNEARELLKPLTWGVHWIPREQNQEADEVGRVLLRELQG